LRQLALPINGENYRTRLSSVERAKTIEIRWPFLILSAIFNFFKIKRQAPNSQWKCVCFTY